jgi:tetratricopeptide (TPR) repeat protein
MSRFGRLEFEHDPKQSLVGQQQQQLGKASEPDRDEHHWMRVASDERRKGLFESALRHYSRALETNRSVVGGWVGQVQMLIALGEYPEAELWSRKALELFKNNADLLAARAQAMCSLGDLKSAQASCDAAIGQPGLFSFPWISRGELMLARKESIEEYCFDKAVQLDDDWLVPLEIGAIYSNYGRTTKALVRTRRAIEQAPEQAYCWYRQGVCELELGLTRPAERSFNRCLQLVPNHSQARAALLSVTFDRRPIRRFLRRMFRFS